MGYGLRLVEELLRARLSKASAISIQVLPCGGIRPPPRIPEIWGGSRDEY